MGKYLFVDEDSKDDIMIMVGSFSGKGKTTIAYVIAEALIDYGIEPNIVLGPDHRDVDEFYSDGHNHFKDKIKAIKESGRRINLQEIQFARKIKEEKESTPDKAAKWLEWIEKRVDLHNLQREYVEFALNQIQNGKPTD